MKCCTFQKIAARISNICTTGNGWRNDCLDRVRLMRDNHSPGEPWILKEERNRDIQGAQCTNEQHRDVLSSQHIINVGSQWT